MKNIKPKGLTTHEKEYTWSKIEAGLTAPVPTFSYVTLFKRAQSKFIAGMVGLLILGGGAATAYAHNAKPGDFLFPVEIAKEKTQIFFAGDEKKREVLHIKFAEKRLAEVRELSALAMLTQNQSAASTTIATSTSAGAASTTTPAPVLTKNDMKKIARAEHAITIALDQLLETRSKLAAAGNANAAFVIDDIIEELKGVGDGTITITRIAAKGNDHNGRVSLRATINATSSASSTFAGTVRIEEKKHGTTIVLNNNDVKTQVTLKNNGSKKENGNDAHGNKHEDKNEKHDDDQDDERADRDRKDNDADKRDGKKLNICHVSGSSRQSLSIAVSAARAHIAHGDTLGVCLNQQPTDTTAPVLTNITATPLQTSATLSWSTNEAASARIWLSTTSPVLTTTTPTQEHTASTLTQSFSLSALTPGTTYYYVLSSADTAGNRATTSGAFTTTLPLDTTAPTISAASVATTTSSATISWATNESTNGTIYYGQVTPVNMATASSSAVSIFGTTHSAVLSPLTASTTYRYIIVAHDNVGNTATSSEQSFTVSGN